MWALPVAALLLIAPGVDAQTVDAVLGQLQSAGVGGVTGYPATQSCSSALGEGGRCVGSSRAACAADLICFRWSPGMGRCQKPSWLASNGNVDASSLLGASAGCAGTAAPSSGPSPQPSPPSTGGSDCDASGSAEAFADCLGYPGVHNYPASAACSSALGEGGRCVGTQKLACQAGLLCYRWSPGMGRCYPPSWFGTTNDDIVEVSTGCSGESPPPTAPPADTATPPPATPAPAVTPPPATSAPTDGGCDASGSAEDFVACLGLNGVHNYPSSTACSAALGQGGRCVGAGKAACQEGLVCFRYRPGMGRCQPPSWFGTTGDVVFQASTGCAGGSPPPAPTAPPPLDPPAVVAPPPPPPPTNSVPGVFVSSTATCRGTTSNLPAGGAGTFITVPAKALELGEYTDLTDGKVELKYDEIPLGGSYCVEDASDTITFGGTLIFNNKGKCNLPPTKSDGSPCCHIQAWQPNTGGFYYDNCSMLQKIGGDGLYWFQTEMPGDESAVGWGPDDKPHIHYELTCSSCAPSDAFDGSSKSVKNKVYPAELCTLSQCGSPGSQHQATEVSPGVFKYDMVL